MLTVNLVVVRDAVDSWDLMKKLENRWCVALSTPEIASVSFTIQPPTDENIKSSYSLGHS